MCPDSAGHAHSGTQTNAADFSATEKHELESAGPVDERAFNARHVLSPWARPKRSDGSLDGGEVSPPDVANLVLTPDNSHQRGDASGAVATKFAELAFEVR